MPLFHRLAAFLIAGLLCTTASALQTSPLDATDLRGFTFHPGDRICLVGSALAERMQHDGWLEARLQCRLPQHELSVRNLGFASDELTVAQRTSGFGSREELQQAGAQALAAHPHELTTLLRPA